MHLYSNFSMDPLDFFLGENLYQKLLFLAILAAVRPHFKATKAKVSLIVGTWETLPHAKFCKTCLRGYTHLGQIYTKNYQFLRFWWL